MSKEERKELVALSTWLKTFPKVEEIASDKENAEEGKKVWFLNSNVASAVLQVAREVCRVDEENAIELNHPDELWDTIISMTSKSNKRKSLEPPPMDTPHMWNNQTKHDALASLLDGAVTHKSIHQRKIYIERIMALNSTTQRALMALIERRKRKTFSNSPGKNRTERASAKKRTKTESSSRLARETNTNSTPPESSNSQKPSPSFRSAFSPPASNMKATPDGVVQPESLQKPQGQVLFATPQRTIDGLSPRRTFEEAFGSSQSVPGMANPSPKRGPFFSPGLGDSALIEKELQELRETNLRLETDLGNSRKRETELTERMEDIEADLRKQMMKIEAEARLREDEVKEAHKNELSLLQADIRSLNEQYEHAERAKEELAGVKEEMELMLHTKGMLADTTERLRKYRERLNQLSDVKDALKREEEAHGKSVEECLRLENEVKALQPVKRQLEEYKTRAVDAEVRFAESQDELRKLKQEKQTLENTNEELVKGKNAQQEEVEEVHRRIHQEDNEKKEATGVGEGLSELNPELKEEVLRLRNENVQLRAFAAKREEDSVQKMEQDLEDASRLSERYKSQFLSTKGDLEATQVDLRESQARETKLKSDLSEWTQKAKGSQERANELSGQLHKCSDDLMNTRTRVASLEKDITELVDQAKVYTERSEDLSERLATCMKDLDASRNREASLKEDVSNLTQQAKASQERAKELSEQHNKQSLELDSIRAIEASLKVEVTEWTKQAKSSQERANELSEQLHICSTELNLTRTREAGLVGELAESQEQAQSLSDQVDGITEELESTKNKLSETRQLELELRNDLADMTGRVEDSEAVSKQRMELLQSTRDKLTVSSQQVEDLKLRKEQLVSDVAAWTERANDAEEHKEGLEKKVAGIEPLLKDAQKKLEESLAEAVALQERQAVLESNLASWKDKVSSAESLTDRLQEELVQTRDILMNTQTTLKQSREKEEMLKSNLVESDKRISELETSLERAIKSRQDAIFQMKKEMETTRANLAAKAEKDLGMIQAKFSSQLEEEVNLGNKHKQELFHAQETLNQTQVSLAESQSRENMLKNDIARLEASRAQLEAELEQSKASIAKVIRESADSLDATKEALRAEAKQHVEELQNNMNQLLEDERHAKRQVDEMSKETLRQQQEESAREASQLKEQAAIDLNAARNSSEERLRAVQLEWEQKIKLVEKNSKEEHDKLITKGKGMLNEVREKARSEIQTLEEEFSLLKDEFSAVRKEKEEIATAYKIKVSEYKKQLQFSTSRVNNLTNDTDELEEKVKNLEREKFKLQEENDRYRRQLGGRFGSDAKVQNQLELLQKEFKTVLDESRELKRKLNEQGLENSGHDMLPPIDETGESLEKSYSRDAVSQSSLVQLRAEYEATLEALNDEKRELVMKNSAAITDVQKAEKRAWEADQVNSTLKHELTSLRLHNERLEHELALTNDENTSQNKRGGELASQPGSHVFGTSPFRSSNVGNGKISGNNTEDDWDHVSATFGMSTSSSRQDENTVPTSEKANKLQKSKTEDDWDQISTVPKMSTAMAPRGLGAETGTMGVLSPSQMYFNGNNQMAAGIKSPDVVATLAKPRSENQNVHSFVELMHKSPGTDQPPECKQC